MSRASPFHELCQHCASRQTFRITTFDRAGAITQLLLCETCAKSVLTRPLPQAIPSQFNDGEVTVQVEQVVIAQDYESHVIRLRENHGERRFTLTLGTVEAWAIDRMLRNEANRRPLTFDSWVQSLNQAGVGIESAHLLDQQDEIVFAELHLRVAERLLRIDVRPSDAIAVATTAKTPIFVANSLLNNSCVS